MVGVSGLENDPHRLTTLLGDPVLYPTPRVVEATGAKPIRCAETLCQKFSTCH
jgi:hypothetical protein